MTDCWLFQNKASICFWLQGAKCFFEQCHILASSMMYQKPVQSDVFGITCRIAIVLWNCDLALSLSLSLTHTHTHSCCHLAVHFSGLCLSFRLSLLCC